MVVLDGKLIISSDPSPDPGKCPTGPRAEHARAFQTLEGDFEQLLAILKNNKRKLSINPVRRPFQKDLRQGGSLPTGGSARVVKSATSWHPEGRRPAPLHLGSIRNHTPAGASSSPARVSSNRTRGSLERTFSMLLAHGVTKDRFASSSLVAVDRQTKRRMVSLASAHLDPYGRSYPLIPVPHRMYPRFYLQSETNRIFSRFL